MLLASVVDTSRRVADTTKRLEKIDLLAQLIRRLSPQEIEIVVPFLSGQARQGRSGSGSQRRRLELLQAMFSRATQAEQQFLSALLIGELRQGALEGIMIEAIA